MYLQTYSWLIGFLISSLTYYLFKEGWKGLNVDLSKISVDLFKILRSQDINLRAAITDYDGNSVESPTLENGMDYYIGVMLTIDGVSIESGESTPIAYGHNGYTTVNLETSGNILENMDYSFDITPRNLFSSNLV